MNALATKKSPFYIILLLILGGEAVFILPFVIARIFRPTYLTVFEIDNTGLGSCFMIYGIVAVISYFFGGYLADRFAPGKLMGTALVLTAAGGVYLLSYPALLGLQLLFGYWGFTTIFLFWAPMIKATRLWGGETNQGKAFGFLEAGRGLVAATIGLIGVFIFANLIGAEVKEATMVDRQYAFQTVVLFAAIFVGLVGVLIFIFLRLPQTTAILKTERSKAVRDYIICLKLPSVRWLMCIVLCAYVGYKTTDFIPQYAADVLGENEVISANVATFLLYLRPLVALVIGFIATKKNPGLLMLFGFLTMGMVGLVFASGLVAFSFFAVFLISTFLLGLGVYGVRTLYFAVFNEGKIPVYLTGTAVGIISVVGYLPDIFMGPLSGYFLDYFEPSTGHRLLYAFLFVMATLGFLATKKFISSTK